MTNKVVVAASGFGRESLDVLQTMQTAGADTEIAGVNDDGPSGVNLQRLHERGVEYRGTIDELLHIHGAGPVFVLGIGSRKVRRMLVQKLEQDGAFALRCDPSDGVSRGRSRHRGGGVGRLLRHRHLHQRADGLARLCFSGNPGGSQVMSSRHRSFGRRSGYCLQQLCVAEGALISAGALVPKNVPSSVIVKESQVRGIETQRFLRCARGAVDGSGLHS